MQYQGGKHKIAAKLLAAMAWRLGAAKWRELTARPLYEPFCGGLNFTEHAQAVFDKVVCADNNTYLIACYKAIKKGWLPPRHVSEREYNRALKIFRAEKKGEITLESEEQQAQVGFILAACSFSGQFAGGYARDKRSSRNYALAAVKSLMRIDFSRISFHCSDYRKLKILPGTIVYCDPPYVGTKRYLSDFDHEAFWFWAENLSKTNYVFVSELSAPRNWVCIASVDKTRGLRKSSGPERVKEKLFQLKQ